MKLKILFFILGVIAGFLITYPENDIPKSAVVGILFGVITVGIGNILKLLNNKLGYY